MTTAAILKLLAILGTAIGGIYGTLYDFKKDGEITKHGRRAIIGIICSLALAVGIQINDASEAKEATAKLKQQNERLEAILRNSEKTAKGLHDATEGLTRIRGAVDESSRSLHNGLDKQLRETRVVNQSLEQSSQTLSGKLSGATSQLNDTVNAVNKQLGASVKQVDQSVRNLDVSAGRALARLSRPIREISFSYTLVYEDAAKRFGPYFERMRNVWLDHATRFDGNDVLRPYGFPTLLVLSEYSKHFPGIDETAFVLAHDSAFIGFVFDGEDLTKREYHAVAWRPESEFLVKNDLARGKLSKVPNGPRIELRLDFDGKGRITKTVSFTATSLERNDGSITSELDITEPSTKPELLLEFRHTTGPPGGRLSEILIHFHDNFYDSIRIDVDACARLEDGRYREAWRCPLKPASR